MATFGDTSDGTGASTSTSTSKAANSATPGATGQVSTLTARVFVTTTAVVCGVIYSDSAGAPANLLAQTDQQTISNTTDQQITFNFTGANLITVNSGTPYWIGFYWQTPSSAGTFSWRRGGTASAAQKDNDTLGGPASTFGTGTGISGLLAVFVTYAPATASSASFVKASTKMVMR